MQTDAVHTRRRLGWATLLTVAGLALAACGSSSSSGQSANALLNQTFSGVHTVKSGNLSVALTIVPTGSSTIKGPITISLGGPFQTQGAGKLPASNFAVTLSGMGRSGSLSLISTGTTGYVTLQGTSYQLPQATFQQLESSFGQLAANPGSSGSKSSSGSLARLGIHPQNWLQNPTVVDNENIGGASTTHIRSGVNVTAFVNDLSTFLQKASTLGVSGTNGLSSGLAPSTRNNIVAAIENPTVDIWTGSGDKTLRKLQLALSVPVTGQLATAAGGASSASISFVIQYADLNQPQSISAPSAVRPYSEFQAKLRSLLQSLTGGLTGGGSSGGSAAGVQSYSACIQAAGNDVSKMQKCASLLGSG